MVVTLLNRLNLICQYDRMRAKKATHVLAIVNGIDKFGNKMYLLPNLYNRTKLLHFCLIVVCLYRMAL